MGAAILIFIIFACHHFRMAKAVNIRGEPEQEFFVRPEPDRNRKFEAQSYRNLALEEDVPTQNRDTSQLLKGLLLVELNVRHYVSNFILFQLM